MVFLVIAITWGFKFAYGLRKDVDPLLGVQMIYPFLSVPIGSLCMLIQVSWILSEQFHKGD
jgi:TRAP-type C4-dicarboxylate transport system permease small subunit